MRDSKERMISLVTMEVKLGNDVVVFVLWAYSALHFFFPIFKYFPRYISILPSIHLSIIVDPQVALQERHPSESQGYMLPSQSLPTQESHSSTENKQASLQWIDLIDIYLPFWTLITGRSKA